jgi:hypothetical protein
LAIDDLESSEEGTKTLDEMSFTTPRWTTIASVLIFQNFNLLWGDSITTVLGENSSPSGYSLILNTGGTLVSEVFGPMNAPYAASRIPERMFGRPFSRFRNVIERCSASRSTEAAGGRWPG